MLRGWLEPMLAQGMDELVLACTHYPLVRPLIERICGPGVEVIDPAPAVARRVAHVLGERGLLATGGTGGLQVSVSHLTPELPNVLRRLGLQAETIAEVEWRGGALVLP